MPPNCRGWESGLLVFDYCDFGIVWNLGFGHCDFPDYLFGSGSSGLWAH